MTKRFSRGFTRQNFSEKVSGGFTLIELLVVIAVIGILASVILASLNSARAKARDARKMADFRQVATAMQFFYDQYGRMPRNHFECGSTVEAETSCSYPLAMGELVSAGFLSQIPKSPGGGLYSYYDYGPGNGVGGLMVTTLETAASTTTGIAPSCRPWNAGTNWCDGRSTKDYCICNPY